MAGTETTADVETEAGNGTETHLDGGPALRTRTIVVGHHLQQRKRMPMCPGNRTGICILRDGMVGAWRVAEIDHPTRDVQVIPEVGGGGTDNLRLERGAGRVEAEAEVATGWKGMSYRFCNSCYRIQAAYL